VALAVVVEMQILVLPLEVAVHLVKVILVEQHLLHPLLRPHLAVVGQVLLDQPQVQVRGVTVAMEPHL
jgi:hypothetical protein